MADLGSITYTAVTWTAGDVITEAKLDNMVANDQAYDSHAAQGLLLNNNKALAAKETGGTNRNLLKMNASDEIEVGESARSHLVLSEQSATPATPASNKVKMYFGDGTVDADKQPILIPDTGTKHYIELASSLYRQVIINGNFDVWQRGTSFTNLDGTAKYTADRWIAYNENAGGHTLSRQDGTGVNGSYYCVRFARNNGSTDLDNRDIRQGLETQDSIKLIGKKLTLSFYARCGANYSPTSSRLVSRVLTGTGTDQSPFSMTGEATAATQNNTLTTSWQRFTVTTSAVIGASITQVAVNFYDTPTGTAGANDWFEITQVQLCAGEVALPFQPKSYGEELRACQRYCQVISTAVTLGPVAMCVADTTTMAFCVRQLPVEMRTAPTLTATASDWVLKRSGANTDLTGLSIGYNGNAVLAFEADVAAGLTAGQAMYLGGDGAGTRLLILSAEL